MLATDIDVAITSNGPLGVPTGQRLLCRARRAVIFRRNALTGALTELAGTAGCISTDGSSQVGAGTCKADPHLLPGQRAHLQLRRQVPLRDGNRRLEADRGLLPTIRRRARSRTSSASRRRLPPPAAAPGGSSATPRRSRSRPTARTRTRASTTSASRCSTGARDRQADAEGRPGRLHHGRRQRTTPARAPAPPPAWPGPPSRYWSRRTGTGSTTWTATSGSRPFASTATGASRNWRERTVARRSTARTTPARPRARRTGRRRSLRRRALARRAHPRTSATTTKRAASPCSCSVPRPAGRASLPGSAAASPPTVAPTGTPGKCASGRALAVGYGMSVSPNGKSVYQATDAGTNSGLAIYLAGRPAPPKLSGLHVSRVSPSGSRLRISYKLSVADTVTVRFSRNGPPSVRQARRERQDRRESLPGSRARSAAMPSAAGKYQASGDSGRRQAAQDEVHARAVRVL